MLKFIFNSINKTISLSESWSKKNESWFSVFFVWPIAQFLNFSSIFIGPVFSIFFVTFFIKFLIFPFLIKSIIQQQKIQFLQPKIDKIKNNFDNSNIKDANLQKSIAIQNIYKKNNINIVESLLGNFFQLPFLFAMYYAVIRAQNISEGYFLNFSLKTTPLHGFKNFNFIIILIYFFMVFTQFFSIFLPQFLFSNKNNNNNDFLKNNKKNFFLNFIFSENNSMSLFTFLIIIFLALNWSISMSLYWTASSLMQIFAILYIKFFKKI